MANPQLKETINIIGDGCVLVLTPNMQFKDEIKKIALNEKVFPQEIDKISETILDDHSVVFYPPAFSSKEERDKIFKKNRNTIYEALLNSWAFPKDSWRIAHSDENLLKYFKTRHYPYLIDIFNLDLTKKGSDFSSLIVSLKNPALEWLQKMNSDIEDSTVTGLAILVPFFKTKKEENKFLKKNYAKIFDNMLSYYNIDVSVWPKGRTYQKFEKWFKCDNYYPIFNLQ